nr:MAG TPA: hypothetical protein [Caudoviricetes sp.]
MRYFEDCDEYDICEELASAVKNSLDKMNETDLGVIRDSIDNSIEFSYDIKDLGIDAPIEKVSKTWYPPYLEHAGGRYIAQARHGNNKLYIEGTVVTVKVTIFDRTKDVVVVWDDYYGTSYCIRMARYQSFREALDEAFKDASPDAMDWLEKEA